MLLGGGSGPDQGPGKGPKQPWRFLSKAKTEASQMTPTDSSEPDRLATASLAYSDPAGRLDREWPSLEHGPIFQALPDWRTREATIRPFPNGQQLLNHLHTNPPERTDQPLLALLRLARVDRLAARLVLQAILPALKAHATRLSHRRDERDELWELLLFYAWEAICCYPLERRPTQVAANLVLQVLHDTTRELSCPSLQRELPYPATAFERARAHSVRLKADSSQSGEALLAAAASAGVVSARDAQLILQTRVDGMRLRLLARVLDVTYASLRQRRQRAEAALRRWLDSNSDVSKTALLVLTYGATSQSPRRPASHRTRPHGRVDRPPRPRRDAPPSRTRPGRRLG
jgi:DNA-directed RNA polymerase specialized sigma24 family protein